MVEAHLKRLALINEAASTAMAIARIMRTDSPHAYLLKKRAFPDRKMPHRIKRKLKKQAKVHRAMMIVQACIAGAIGAANAHRILSTPSPSFCQS